MKVLPFPPLHTGLKITALQTKGDYLIKPKHSSSIWMCLEILSIKVMNRNYDKWQTWWSPAPTGNGSRLIPEIETKADQRDPTVATWSTSEGSSQMPSPGESILVSFPPHSDVTKEAVKCEAGAHLVSIVKKGNYYPNVPVKSHCVWFPCDPVDWETWGESNPPKGLTTEDLINNLDASVTVIVIPILLLTLLPLWKTWWWDWGVPQNYPSTAWLCPQLKTAAV